VLFGACQQQVSLSDMQPLHQQQERIAQRLAQARADGRCNGAMLLATCNRFEVVVDAAGADPDALRAEIFAGIDVPLHEFRDADAVAHLIRVATGLESLVLGEDQILGQVGQAFRECEAQGLLGKGLHMVYSRVMHAARKARQTRPVVSAPRSVAELAARICRQAGGRVAIVGAGTTAHTAAESLRDLGARALHFASRTVAHARRLAAHFDGTAGSLDDLLATPPDVDAVIVAISGRLLKLPVARMPSLQTVVDISQPAVAVGLDQHPDVRHLDLDGLARLEQEHEQALRDWRDHAQSFAADEAGRIWHELEQGKVDLGQLLGLHVENASAEVERALRGKLRALDPDLADEVRRLAERVARRNAHLHLSDVKHFATP
jgi:glutamyl-tRNA reductase